MGRELSWQSLKKRQHTCADTPPIWQTMERGHLHTLTLDDTKITVACTIRSLVHGV